MMVREELMEDVIEVRRITLRIMLIGILIGGKLFNMFSVYAPQVGRADEQNEEFWGVLDDEMAGLKNEVFVGGELNGYLGQSRDGFEAVMGVYGFGERNRRGKIYLRFVRAGDWFRKHYVQERKRKESNV